ncbi:protein of unknown function [Thiomonas sp. Bio17B3]|nr:protein of unknown function [Thiomonas sp. Bio17B3]VDY10113.1 protein of unknown function [Thiomonas sp. Sup16B3]VDY15958.1 protein of unknown function [Thiomonas sp. CB2]
MRMSRLPPGVMRRHLCVWPRADRTISLSQIKYRKDFIMLPGVLGFFQTRTNTDAASLNLRLIKLFWWA